MVPLVKDSLLCCTGLPTLFQRAKCLYLMLDLCYLSMKLQMRTSYTCGTSRVISSIPACGHKHKWSSLLLCHPILVLTCRQLLPLAVFEISNVFAHKVFVGWPYGQYLAWPRLIGIIPKGQKFLSPCHTESVSIFQSYILETQSCFVAWACGLAAILNCVFQPPSCGLGCSQVSKQMVAQFSMCDTLVAPIFLS